MLICTQVGPAPPSGAMHLPLLVGGVRNQRELRRSRLVMQEPAVIVVRGKKHRRGFVGGWSTPAFLLRAKRAGVDDLNRLGRSVFLLGTQDDLCGEHLLSPAAEEVLQTPSSTGGLTGLQKSGGELHLRKAVWVQMILCGGG